MKKLSISLLFLTFFQLATYAQFNKWGLFVDGSIGMGSYNNLANSNTSSGFTFAPDLGIFVSKNWAIGIGFGYQNYKYTYNLISSINTGGESDYTETISSTNKLSEMSPTIFVKYLHSFNDKLSLSLKGSYAHGWCTNRINQTKINSSTNIKNVIIDDKSNNKSNYFQLSPELQYMITPKFGLLLNFHGLIYESTDKYESDFYSYIDQNAKVMLVPDKKKVNALDFSPKMWTFGIVINLSKSEAASK